MTQPQGSKNPVAAFLIFGGMIAGTLVVFAALVAEGGWPTGEDTLFFGFLSALVGCPVGGTLGRLIVALRKRRSRKGD
jgi:hypothetical protein